MSIHGGNFRSKHRLAEIVGIGNSERDTLLSQFARQADLSLNDAISIVAGTSPKICPVKLSRFCDAASRVYGDMDTFKIVYDSMA